MLPSLRRAVALVVLALPLSAFTAPVTLTLTGNNGKGALNMPGFDNENAEPSGPGESFGYAYFFNEENGLWSILPSSPTTNSVLYYESVLFRSGITNYSNLTLSSVVVDPNAALVNFGTVTYEGSLLTGVGTEVLAPGQFTLAPSSADFRFNEEGYPGFNDFAFGVGNMTGPGITFVNGVLTSMDFTAEVSILSNAPFNLQWTGSLNFSGLDFAYDINESQTLFPGAELRFLLDRSGTITAVPEPSALLLLGLAGILGALRLRRRASAH